MTIVTSEKEGMCKEGDLLPWFSQASGLGFSSMFILIFHVFRYENHTAINASVTMSIQVP